MWKSLYCREYLADLEYVCKFGPIDWASLQNRTLLISGATGLIGSFLIDALMQMNVEDHLNCNIVALSRDARKAQLRFGRWKGKSCLEILNSDVCQPVKGLWKNEVDYILHLASNTHPVAYASDPIGTIKTNILGADNLLELTVSKKARRFLLASSNEIYGENRGDTQLFEESYCGYIDCNTLRAGYPESKRCAEALVQSYRKYYGVNAVIARFTRTYGPTLLPDDSKALSQFLQNALQKEDIILKSSGNQYYSYTYVADAVTGLLTVLTAGKDGEAYNISEPSFDIRLNEIADIIAGIEGTSVCYDKPDEIEASGFSRVTVSRLANDKLCSLGWYASYPLEKGLRRTIQIIRLHDRIK